MSFMFSDDKKTSTEWRWDVDGLMSHFRDEYDEIPITYDEWVDGSYREPSTVKKED
jgi:arginyl-tRNA synthetase